MTVSVIMPVFDGAAHVADAVASVLRQAPADFELLIHDDGSSDETATVLGRLAAEDPRIDVSRGPNRGPAASRNRLLARAGGAYIAFLDHDDIWPDGRLARQQLRLDGAPAAPGVLGEALMFEALDGDGVPIRTGRSRRALAGLLQAGLFRRSAVQAAGPFAEGFGAGDDFDWLLRLIETSGPLEIEHEIAVWYRLHPGQRTADLELSGQGTARALARSVRRRRLAGLAGPIAWRVSPVVSVLMATFNGEAFVEEAIASVLAQRGVQLELVVTDDGSTDTTASIVSGLARRDPRIRFAVQPHAGMAEARNACMARARGTCVALLDQDDRWPEGKLARQLGQLETSPDIGAVFGHTQMFDSEREQAPGYTMLLSAGLLRREILEAVGRFDPGCGSADDFDFLLRMIEQGHRIELESGLGVCHRRHRDQVSADLDATRRDCVRVLARSLQRRRGDGAGGPLEHPLVAGAL